jgi:hypothetical protein
MFDGTYWIGVFERNDEQGYSVGKFIFGKEPSDEEVYEFILHGYRAVRFTQPMESNLPDTKHMSFKRRQREIERILANAFPAEQISEQVRAQEEADRQAREKEARIRRKAEEEHKYQLRQAKRHEKHRGR